MTMRLSRLALGILFGLVALFLHAPEAGARVRVEVRAGSERAEISLVGDPDLAVRMERRGDRLILSFEGDRAPDPGPLPDMLARFVAGAAPEEAGRKLALVLRRGTRAELVPVGAGRWRLVLERVGTGDVGVRIGKGPRRLRLVFEGPDAAAARVQPTKSGIRLRFARPLAAEVEGALAKIGAVRSRIAGRRDVVLEPRPGWELRTLSLPPDRFVVDVLKRDAQSASPLALGRERPPAAAAFAGRPLPEAAGDHGPGPAVPRSGPGGVTAERSHRNVGDGADGTREIRRSVPTSEPSRPETARGDREAETVSAQATHGIGDRRQRRRERPAGPASVETDHGAFSPEGGDAVDLRQTSVDRTPAVLRVLPDGDGLRFSWSKPTGAAAIRRGRRLFLVFDRPVAEVGAERAALAAVLAKRTRAFRVVKREDGTLVRLDLADGVPVRIEGAGREWRLAFVSGHPSAVLTPVPRHGGMLVPGARAAMPFTDEVAGEPLVAITVPQAAVPAGPMRFVDFDVPASLVGAIVRPRRDDLMFETVSDGVLIGRPGGLRLGHVADAPPPGGPRAKAGKVGEQHGPPGGSHPAHANAHAGVHAAAATTSPPPAGPVTAESPGRSDAEETKPHGKAALGAEPSVAGQPEHGDPPSEAVVTDRGEANHGAVVPSPALADEARASAGHGIARQRVERETADAEGETGPEQVSAPAGDHAVPDSLPVAHLEAGSPPSTAADAMRRPKQAARRDASEASRDTAHRRPAPDPSPAERGQARRELHAEPSTAGESAARPWFQPLPWKTVFGLAELAEVDAERRDELRRVARAHLADPDPEMARRARLELARLDLADALGPEARTILALLDGSADARRRALELAAAALAGDRTRMDALLADPQLARSPEAALYRALREAADGRWEAAGRDLDEAHRVLKGYPAPLQKRLGPVIATIALQIGNPNRTFVWLDRLSRLGLERPLREKLRFLEALAVARDGSEKEAVRILRELEREADWLVGLQAAFARLRIERDAGRLTPKQALARLEQLAPLWRGHPWEPAMLRMLGDLRAQAGRVEDALAAWRELIARFPNAAEARGLPERMRALVRSALDPEAEPRLQPREALRLWDRYPELVVPDDATLAALGRLAAALADGDLPARALALVERLERWSRGEPRRRLEELRVGLLLRVGRAEEALALAEELARTSGGDGARMREIAPLVARAALEAGQPERALALERWLGGEEGLRMLFDAAADAGRSEAILRYGRALAAALDGTGKLEEPDIARLFRFARTLREAGAGAELAAMLERLRSSAPDGAWQARFAALRPPDPLPPDAEGTLAAVPDERARLEDMRAALERTLGAPLPPEPAPTLPGQEAGPEGHVRTEDGPLATATPSPAVSGPAAASHSRVTAGETAG